MRARGWIDERDAESPTLLAVEVQASTDEPTRLDVVVRYVPIGENVPRNLVHPFYLDGSGA